MDTLARVWVCGTPAGFDTVRRAGRCKPRLDDPQHRASITGSWSVGVGWGGSEAQSRSPWGGSWAIEIGRRVQGAAAARKRTRERSERSRVRISWASDGRGWSHAGHFVQSVAKHTDMIDARMVKARSSLHPALESIARALDAVQRCSSIGRRGPPRPPIIHHP